MIEFHNAWLLKAENDLLLAEVAIRRDDPITDGAIYHTQQCAEKALKGFLTFKRSKIKKTHNLAELVIQCADFDPDFESLLQALICSNVEFSIPPAAAVRFPAGL